MSALIGYKHSSLGRIVSWITSSTQGNEEPFTEVRDNTLVLKLVIAIKSIKGSAKCCPQTSLMEFGFLNKYIQS